MVCRVSCSTALLKTKGPKGPWSLIVQVQVCNNVPPAVQSTAGGTLLLGVDDKVPPTCRARRGYFVVVEHHDLLPLPSPPPTGEGRGGGKDHDAVSAGAFPTRA